MSGTRWANVAVLALVAVLGGCMQLQSEPGGGAPAPATASVVPTPSPSRAAGRQRLVASATVLDNGTGPELCLGGVMESLPPQCGGPPLEDWVWPKTGVERRNRVTWGSFFVVGTWDGARFRLDRLVTHAQAAASLPTEGPPDFGTPCDEPAGGWRPVDPDRISEADQEMVFAVAEGLSGYGGAWVDDRGDQAQPRETTVVNVRVTHDRTAAEARLRAVWGGPLCVSMAEHSEHELKQILDSVAGRDGFLGGSYGRGRVEISVIYDDGALQERLDRRFGIGLVQVDSALRPYLG